MRAVTGGQDALGWVQGRLARRRWDRFRSWLEVGIRGGGLAGLVAGVLGLLLLVSNLGNLLDRVPAEPGPGVTVLMTTWVPWLGHLLPLGFALGAGLDFFPVPLHPFLLYQVIHRGTEACFLRSAIWAQALRSAFGAALGAGLWFVTAWFLKVPLPSRSVALAVAWVPAAAAAPAWAGSVALMPAPARGWIRLLRPAVLLAGLALLGGAAALDRPGAAWAMLLWSLALPGFGWLAWGRARRLASPWVVLEGETIRRELGRAPARRLELLRLWRKGRRNRLARALACLRLPGWCRGGWTYVWRAILLWVGEHPLQPLGLAALGLLSLVRLPQPLAGEGWVATAVDFAGAGPGPEALWAYLGGLLSLLGLTLARLLEPAWYSEIQRDEVRRQLPRPGAYLFWNGALPAVVAGLAAVAAVSWAAGLLEDPLSRPPIELLRTWAAIQAILWVFCLLHEPIWSQIPPPLALNPFQPSGSAAMARSVSLAYSLLPGFATTLGTAWLGSETAGLLVGIVSVPLGIAALWRWLRNEWKKVDRARSSL